MKKLIFTALSTLAMISVFAQAPVDDSNMPRFKALDSPMKTLNKHTYGKDVTSNWYEPYDFADRAAGGTPAGRAFLSFVNFLFPDSITKYIDNTGAVYHVGATNVGQVLDPKDDNIGLLDNSEIKMSKYNAYTLDSIYFRYLYVRNVDSVPDGSGGNNAVVDTLYIHYFLPSALSTNSTNLAPEIYAYPTTFNMAARRPAGMIASQTILLTAADSTIAAPNTTTGVPESGWYSKYRFIKAPAGINVGASAKNIVAFNLKFKPGHPYDSSSIMIYQQDPATLPAGAKRINYFGYSTFNNGNTAPYPTQVQQTKFYNNTLVATKTASYPNNPQGWQGYVPGNAFFAHQYLVCGFLLTSGNVGIKEIKNDNFAMSNVYPNPAFASEGAVVAFNLKSSATVTIGIYDLVGQLVKTVVNKNFNSGENNVDISLSGMKAGVYFLNMTSNGTTTTKKLTVVE